jgi:Beta/Gamma crystallin
MWNKTARNAQERRMTTTRTQRPNWHLALWTLLIAATALGGSTSAQFRRDGGSGPTVYADINFGGQSTRFTGDTPNTASAGWNDNISSLRIPNGETWEICQDVDYGNECQAVSGSVANLRSIGWNDRISSMRRINAGYPGRRRGGNRSDGSGMGVTLYVDPNFRGQSASFRDDTPNLVPFNLNDKVSSIRIPTGESWQMCVDIDYRSQCQPLTDSVADLRSMGWNDRISSLRRVNDGGYGDRRSDRSIGTTGGGTSVTVYDGPNFRGQSVTFRDDRPNLVSFNMNDRVSSIRISDGEAWEVCQDIDYGNQCQVLASSVVDLRSMGWNDRISSLRRADNGGYRDGGSRDRRPDGVFQNGAQQGLMFYDQSNYRGRSTLVTSGSSARMGFPTRQGSIQVRGAGAWELCDGSGNCATINQNVPDISRIGLNDRITSARIVNNSQYRRDRD